MVAGHANKEAPGKDILSRRLLIGIGAHHQRGLAALRPRG